MSGARVLRLLDPPAILVPEPLADCETLDLLNYELVLQDGRRISLRVQECVILGVLAQATGDFHNRQCLAQAIYGHVDRWSDTWEAVVSGNISRMRKMLHELGCSFSIITHGQYSNDGIGYRLSGKLHVISHK